MCLSRRPRQCILQVSRNTLQQVETFKYLGVVFTSDGSRNKGSDTRTGKANVFLRELYYSVVTKRELSKTANLSVFNIGLCSDPHLWLWVLSDDWNNTVKRTNGRDGIFAEFSVWHFVTKSTGLKSVKPGTSSHFFESRDSSYVSSAMHPECPGKEWRTKSFKLSFSRQCTVFSQRPQLTVRSRSNVDTFFQVKLTRNWSRWFN